MKTADINKTARTPIGTGKIYEPGDKLPTWEYEAFFTTEDVNYTIASPYIVVGNEKPSYGWIIYISVIRQQANSLFSLLLPKLLRKGVYFEIPENSAVHSTILEGGFGYGQVGKIINIYPHNDEIAVAIANELVELTMGFAGPEIPTAMHLKGIVYAGGDQGGRLNYSWPFDLIARPVQPKAKKWLKRYFIVQRIKGDAKGNVYKCLDVKQWVNIRWCLIKEGLCYQCADDFGRTVKDRLKWQFELLSKLKGKISLPKAIEYFEHQGDAYLVTEFISGQILYEMINVLQGGVVWMSIPLESKRILVKILLDIISIINEFHANGLIHRDITPGNFLIQGNAEIVAIDIELVYDCTSISPNPAFSYGTPGYISPQQQSQLTPVVEDDIYGLGGLMVKIFTGISPTKFESANSDLLFKNLTFLIGNDRIASMICSCLQSDGAMRPNIKSISHTLNVYDALLLTDVSNDKVMVYNKIDPHINSIIQKAINAFMLPELLDIAGCWISKNTTSDDLIANEYMVYQCLHGFANGISGVLYLLAEAEKSGFDTTALHDLIYHNYIRLKESPETFISKNDGYFFGTAGVAVAINNMLCSGLLENTIINDDLIYKALNNDVNGVSIATGLAGKGLAMLKCQSNSKLPNLYEMVSVIAGSLIKQQNKDGSWHIKENEGQKKGVSLYSLYYGMSGVIYFLLEYYERYEDAKIKSAIIKSLDWLKCQRTTVGENLLWPISNKNKSVDPWLEFGFTGIALTYIRAYEVLKVGDYKNVAISTLHNHPENILSNHITYANGLSGLGEVYLYAYKVFEQDEYLIRASHIVNVLSNLFKQPYDNSIYWLESNHSSPAADLMGGVAGIIHFMINYKNPKKMRLLF